MMVTTNTRHICITIGLLLCTAAAYFLFFSPQSELSQRVAACDTEYERTAEKINCWYELIREKVRTEGIAAAFTVIEEAYAYNTFSEMSCHEHTHVIGDTAYYEKFLNTQDIEKMSFPEETKYCGYGFWHGFIEHFVQDRPDPGLVDETCIYLANRYGGTMHDIALTCYHAAGHGFMLEPIEDIQRDEGMWGDFNALVFEPLKNCEALKTTQYIQECKIGIFNVIGLWMFDEEYGLSYNWDDPFDVCRRLESDDQTPCYNEMAQKLDSLSDWDLRNAATYVSDIDNEQLASKVIGVAAASMMLRDINTDRHYEYLKQCREIPERLKAGCVHGIVSGLFEYGEPNKEYSKAIPFCESDALTEEERSGCYTASISRMKRFYTNEKVAHICTSYSDDLVQSCIEHGVPVRDK